MAFKIYTKTGDKGTTGLIGGTRVSKSNLRIEAYGTVDELNAHLGLLIDGLKDHATLVILRKIQDRLFTIGSSLACDPQKDTKMKIPDLSKTDTQLLESEIDRMEDLLPPLRSFILPGGHSSVSQAHVCRCICRRAERVCVHLADVGEFVEPIVIEYLNRLSDFLFVVSRYVGYLLGVAEISWKPRM